MSTKASHRSVCAPAAKPRNREQTLLRFAALGMLIGLILVCAAGALGALV